jgi:hypothetical protein
VSFVSGEPAAHDVTTVGPKFATGAQSEAASDAWIGGAAGLAVGMMAMFLPGIGPLIAAGPLAGAIGGLSVGAAAGGLVGLLRDHGVPEEEAEFYQEGLRRGGSIIVVRDLTEAERAAASDVLSRHGARDIEELAEEWRRVPQP